MKLIDKGKVISILQDKIADIKLDMKCGFLKERKGVEKICVLKNVISALDTLEVKEVDLELNSFDAIVCKIGSTYLKEMDRDAIVKVLESFKDGDKVKVIIKAQKGE